MTTAEQPELINILMLSQRLGVSPKTIYTWVHFKKIPYVKMGRLVKFQSSEIQDWIENNKVKNIN